MIYTSPAYAQCGVAVLQEPPAFTANKSPEKRIVDSTHNLMYRTNIVYVGQVNMKQLFKSHNKPKEYPQQRETKIIAKHAMSEVCLLPRPFYSRGRARKVQSQHKHFMKKMFFQKRLQYCGQYARSSCKGFSSQRTAIRLILHFIYLTYIIHISYVH